MPIADMQESGIPVPPPHPAASATINVAAPGENPVKHYLYLCGQYVFPVFLLSRDGHQVSAIIWQGRRCDCSMNMASPTSMTLNFHCDNDPARRHDCTYEEIATYNGMKIWRNGRFGAQFMLEPMITQ